MFKINRAKQMLMDSGVVISPLESAKLLAKIFYPKDCYPRLSSTNKSNHHNQVREEVSKWEKHLYNPSFQNFEFFQMHEFMAVIRNMSHKTAPGNDSFTADICAKAYRLNLFLSILNQCLRLTCFPRICKESSNKNNPREGGPLF